MAQESVYILCTHALFDAVYAYGNRTMKPVEFVPGMGRAMRYSDRGDGSDWSNMCTYGNIAMKLLCTTNTC